MPQNIFSDYALYLQKISNKNEIFRTSLLCYSLMLTIENMNENIQYSLICILRIKLHNIYSLPLLSLLLHSLKVSQPLSLCNIHMCKSLQTYTHTHTHTQTHFILHIFIQHKAFNISHWDRYTQTCTLTCKDANRMQPFWHSPCAASYTVYPSFWKVTLYNTLRISHHTHPFSSHRVICSLLVSTRVPLVQTHHTDILRGAADRYAHHLQVKLSERNSLWLFPFFFCSLDVLWGSCYGDRIQRQLWQPMYTRVGRALSLSFWVCASRFVCPA